MGHTGGPRRQRVAMKRYVLLDITPIPNHGGALCPLKYGEDFVIKLESGRGGQLMNTRLHGSEDALTEIPCKKVAARPHARVLIGGLGMGFTLAPALKHLQSDAEVLAAELVPGVIDWNRGPLGAQAGNPLDDPRTTVLNDDVANILRAEAKGFDVIMLDVDNGPEGLTHRDNNWLYSVDGLAACARALIQSPAGQAPTRGLGRVRVGTERGRFRRAVRRAAWPRAGTEAERRSPSGQPAPTRSSPHDCARPISTPKK